MDKKKIIALVFRFAIIITGIALLVAVISIIGSAFSSDDLLDEDTVSALVLSTNMYYVGFVGSLIALVLSFVAKDFCKKISIVARTFFMMIASVLMIAGMKFNNALSFSSKLIKEYGDIDLTFADPEDYGITEKKLEQLEEAIESESTMAIYLVAMLVGAAIYLILALTSLHYLAKKKNN